jgi:hypothetical protein
MSPVRSPPTVLHVPLRNPPVHSACHQHQHTHKGVYKGLLGRTCICKDLLREVVGWRAEQAVTLADMWNRTAYVCTNPPTFVCKHLRLQRSPWRRCTLH